MMSSLSFSSISSKCNAEIIELITYFSSLGSTSSESLNICPILPVSFCIFFVISSSPKSSAPSSPVVSVSSSPPSVSPSSSLKSSASSSEKPNSSSSTSSSTGASVDAAGAAAGVADAGASTLSTFFSSSI